MPRYVVLLRGINVGGRNKIAMSKLKLLLEELGFADVATYIQSGNVLFESRSTDAVRLTAVMEKALLTAFCHEVPVFLRSQAQLKTVVSQAPQAWKTGKALRQNVAFLRAPLTAKRALCEIDVRPDVDAVTAGNGVLYMPTVMSRVKQSRLPKIVATPIYRDMTIRSYSTCQKILALMDQSLITDH